MSSTETNIEFLKVNDKYPAAVGLSDIPTNQCDDDSLVEISRLLAEKNDRGRAIIRIHDDGQEMHLMINTIGTDSYVVPHRHNQPTKSETFRILQGSLGVLLFDDEGEIKDIIILSADSLDERKIVTIRSGIWHTVVPLTDSATIIEGKRHDGGYDPKTDKEFPSWAPLENDPNAENYARYLYGVASWIELTSLPPGWYYWDIFKPPALRK